VNDRLAEHINQVLTDQGINTHSPWLIFHPGVSETKREYPAARWAAAGHELIQKGYQLIITGAATEKKLCEVIKQQIGKNSVNAAGLFNIEEFTALISLAPVVVSVNTGTIHIAAALGTPVVVLYALTNPQHTPWRVPCKVLPFQVPQGERSKNEVIRHVNRFLYSEPVDMPDGSAVACAVDELFKARSAISYAAATVQLPAHILLAGQAD
jgi:ADP-heptose:LPS heptosyltransferase